jgi:hypothetical protein
MRKLAKHWSKIATALGVMCLFLVLGACGSSGGDQGRAGSAKSLLTPKGGVASAACIAADHSWVDGVMLADIAGDKVFSPKSDEDRVISECSNLSGEQFVNLTSSYVWTTYGEAAGEAFDKGAGLPDSGV